MAEPPQLPPSRRGKQDASRAPELYSEEWYAGRRGKKTRASTPQRRTGEVVVADGTTPTAQSAVAVSREEQSSRAPLSGRRRATTPAKRAERARLRARLARAEQEPSADGPPLHSNPSFKQEGNQAVAPDDAERRDVPATPAAVGGAALAVPKSALGRKARAVASSSAAANAPSDCPQENEEGAPHPEQKSDSQPELRPELPDLSEIHGLDPEYESWLAGILFGAEMLAELLDANDDTALGPGKAAVSNALYDVHFEALEMARAAAPSIVGRSATRDNRSARGGPQAEGQLVKLGQKWVVRSRSKADTATGEAKADAPSSGT